MIEKEKQRAPPQEYWRSEKNQSHEIEEASVFDNCLTGTKITPSSTDLDSRNTDHKGNPSTDRTKETDEDSGNIASGNTLFDDLDETDYFDSEDEYWDTLRNKEIKDDLCQHCRSYHLPRSTQDILTCPLAEVYDTYPAYTPAVQKFARENNFEIHDVYGDEDCLFRAVADQFMINGCPGHTEVSLRKTAIKHLKKDSEKYGVHDIALLSEDTWETCLLQMDKTREWGNRILMQVLADIFVLHISIFDFVHNDVRHVCITSEPAEMIVSKKLHIFLGQVGELHVFSFRPLKWMTELPYKAQIFRMLAICTEKTCEERRKLVDKMFEMMSPRHFPKSNLVEHIQFVLQSISFQEKPRRSGASEHTYSECEKIFKSYSGRDLELEEVADIRSKLVEDQSRVDSLSGIPLPFLSFIMKLIFPYKMFDGEYVKYPLLMIGEIYYHFLGSYADQSCLTLQDISRTGKMHRRFMEERSKPNYFGVVVLKRDVRAIYEKDYLDDYTGVRYVIADTSNSYPGYCRLRLSSTSSIRANENVAQIGSVMYQKPFRITDKLRSDVEHYGKVQCIGVSCNEFPFMHRWKKRKYDFPSSEVISSIIENGVTLIPNSHPKSTCPELEWQFNFSMAEHLLLKSLTSSQRHGFFVVKLLLSYMVHHTPFTEKHCKSVFFMACEEMSVDIWETNFSGCVLYVLSFLLSCLKAKFLPNYFIPENNLIESFRDDDIGKLSTIVEFIRLFPTCVIEFVAEEHGLTYGSNLIKSVLSMENYSADRQDFQAALDELFGHLTINAAKMMAKMGFYSISLDILQDRFEQSLLSPQIGLRQTSISFCDFFLSALMEIRQKSSRINLARTIDMTIGSNVSDMILEKQKVTLQTHLPWKIDPRLGWIEVPRTNSTDLTAIAGFLYDFSKKEYWRRNTVLAELAITTAIQCIQETLKQNLGLKRDDVQKRILKRKLISFYKHAFSISLLNHSVHPLIDHMDKIEDLCSEFPEIAGIVFVMLMYIGQPSKGEEYLKKRKAHVYGSKHGPKTRFPIWKD